MSSISAIWVSNVFSADGGMPLCQRPKIAPRLRQKAVVVVTRFGSVRGGEKDSLLPRSTPLGGRGAPRSSTMPDFLQPEHKS